MSDPLVVVRVTMTTLRLLRVVDVLLRRHALHVAGALPHRMVGEVAAVVAAVAAVVQPVVAGGALVVRAVLVKHRRCIADSALCMGYLLALGTSRSAYGAGSVVVIGLSCGRWLMVRVFALLSFRCFWICVLLECVQTLIGPDSWLPAGGCPDRGWGGALATTGPLVHPPIRRMKSVWWPCVCISSTATPATLYPLPRQKYGCWAYVVIFPQGCCAIRSMVAKMAR